MLGSVLRFSSGRKPFGYSLLQRRSYANFADKTKNIFHDERTWAIGSLLLTIPALFWVYEKRRGQRIEAIEEKLLHGSIVEEEKEPVELVQSVKEAIVEETPACSFKEPEYPPFLSSKYLLIGGGTASAAALEAILEYEPHADIVILTKDDFDPYMRPPLSKELWFSDPKSASSFIFTDWEGNKKTIFYRDAQFYEDLDIANHIPGKVRILRRKQAVKMDLDNKTVTLENGTVVKYGKVLIATGGSPRIPSVAQSIGANNYSTFRSANDFLLLKKLVESGKDIAIYGGGFLGSELAVALQKASEKYGNKIHQIIPEEGNLSLVFPTYLSKWISRKLKEMGIETFCGTKIKSLDEKKNGKISIKLEDGSEITADHIVFSLGVTPNVEIAQKAGLELDEVRGGIMTNAELEARTDVFAAGDVISFHDVTLGRRRVEHHDHAVLSGITAGTNMTGKSKPFKHQSMFWSDLGPSISFEAVGNIDSSLSTVAVWTKNDGDGQNVPVSGENVDFNKGLIFYLKEQKIVGVLMFNLPNKVSIAKNILLKNSEEINQLIDQFHLYQ